MISFCCKIKGSAKAVNMLLFFEILNPEFYV